MKASTLPRYVLDNFLKLLSIVVLVMMFYFFFTFLLQEATFHLVSVFSFNTVLSSKDFNLLTGLQNVEVLVYFLIILTILLITSVLSGLILHKPFVLAARELNQFLDQYEVPAPKLNVFFQNTKVIEAINLFEYFIKGDGTVSEKIDKLKQNKFSDNLFVLLFFHLSLIPMMITFVALIYHISYTYNENLVNLASSLNNNVVLAGNLLRFNQLMYVISFLTVLFFIFLLCFYSWSLTQNYSGASYSFIKTLSCYTRGELNQSFYFRDNDPSLPLLSELHELEKKMKPRLMARSASQVTEITRG